MSDASKRLRSEVVFQMTYLDEADLRELASTAVHLRRRNQRCTCSHERDLHGLRRCLVGGCACARFEPATPAEYAVLASLLDTLKAP